ncbi:MAG: hydantoinase/oxoprolinase family protein [Acidimicrobiales bacterium]|jgi:N-methylhydantoinase A|nr:methylhydantoinase [Acidimicrobiaceae bacterium]MDP6162042.1 hydantoinase/oxoprolinase family protein [Acidimicrobiales bacterium]MDP6284873.1 hydantoinase/oxoprolinase family protein [Acidimicrobiales bacterium]HJL90874.1 hydantoinase/oxoprolinase family protein [Acidimicrobiales bacterium]HJO41687.1 hydantoinase/oxoprolinase family protein [Acidimicrobiales bacterium]
MVTNKIRIGADVGGTFTDVVLETEREIFSTKVLTTYESPEIGILQGINAVIDDSGTDLSELDSFIHGTTLATNALISRTGARTAFVTTKGFRDTVEMRTESRFEQYDLNLELPKPLIERKDRYVLSERISADGSVLLPFDETEAKNLIDLLALEENGYEAVAVGFIHSYMNNSHESLFQEILLDQLPDMRVSISSEVSPQMREFERFNTVCANAYVQPMMAAYLERLKTKLADAGAKCDIHLIHSGGGLISIESAIKFPVRLIESGPAGGAIFASEIAARHGIDAALSYDMGGTTAKICLIDEQSPRSAKTFEVARTHRFTKGSGMPISIPVIEMIEIGAGGGSIANVDDLKQIRVGPLSAGSEPGPAAYGLGGSLATVTDANILLGRISPETFGADDINLLPEESRKALLADVAEPLEVDVENAAIGIIEVVDENMANAARVHAVENGRDVSQYTMIAFGGGAPLHASRLCDKLEIEKLLIPPGAGVGSAIGFLRTPFSYEALKSFYVSVENFDHESVNQLLSNLTSEATEFVMDASKENFPVESLIVERCAFMRYVGQGWEIPVPLENTTFDHLGIELLNNEFEKTYEEHFGRAIEGLQIEVVGWSVKVTSPRPEIEKTITVGSESIVTSNFKRVIYDPSEDSEVNASIFERENLTPGDCVMGPAIIVEDQTTTWISSEKKSTVQQDECLLITKKAEAAE